MAAALQQGHGGRLLHINAQLQGRGAGGAREVKQEGGEAGCVLQPVHAWCRLGDGRSVCYSLCRLGDGRSVCYSLCRLGDDR